MIARQVRQYPGIVGSRGSRSPAGGKRAVEPPPPVVILRPVAVGVGGLWRQRSRPSGPSDRQRQSCPTRAAPPPGSPARLRNPASSGSPGGPIGPPPAGSGATEGSRQDRQRRLDRREFEGDRALRRQRSAASGHAVPTSRGACARPSLCHPAGRSGASVTRRSARRIGLRDSRSRPNCVRPSAASNWPGANARARRSAACAARRRPSALRASPRCAQTSGDPGAAAAAPGEQRLSLLGGAPLQQSEAEEVACPQVPGLGREQDPVARQRFVDSPDPVSGQRARENSGGVGHARRGGGPPFGGLGLTGEGSMRHLPHAAQGQHQAG